MEKKRELIYFKSYFWDFFNLQTEKVKDKIDYVLYLVTNADKIPKKFFDSMTGYKGLFEIKIELESNIFRIFCCFDKGDLIILLKSARKKLRARIRNLKLKFCSLLPIIVKNTVIIGVLQ